MKIFLKIFFENFFFENFLKIFECLPFLLPNQIMSPLSFTKPKSCLPFNLTKPNYVSPLILPNQNHVSPLIFPNQIMSIMERIIQDDLLDKCREFIDPFQHGFLSSKSCTTNLINITDGIASNLHNDIGTDIIYFDFAKAFDNVNHDLL